ncbi:hypothetical protein BV898_12538 [Hypsibius exemplaris]|uniref:Uncharacterized protein n=1 Tax=Hypsibius exemplaris TaxID=2072580 RepID=A0A1W0WDC7_HYPEX|nr:hypothetical protein BV898_12538 [Hypsibius exemplaris]
MRDQKKPPSLPASDPSSKQQQPIPAKLTLNKTSSSSSSLPLSPHKAVVVAAIPAPPPDVRPTTTTTTTLLTRKISLTLTHEAAARLKDLTTGSTSGLSALGILSGTVGPPDEIGQPPQPQPPPPLFIPAVPSRHLLLTHQTASTSSAAAPHHVKSTIEHGSSKKQRSTSSQLVNGAGNNIAVVQRVPNNLTTATTAAQQQHVVPPTSTASIVTGPPTVRVLECTPLLQPNVVASMSHSVPVPQAISSPVSASHASPSSLYPFSSMTKNALTIKTTSSTSSISSTVSSSSSSSSTSEAARQKPKMNRSASVVPTSSTIASGVRAVGPAIVTIKGKPRSNTLNSPLLINLLQTVEGGGENGVATATSPSRSQPPGLLTFPTTAKRPRKKKGVSESESDSVSKEPVKKKKKLTAGSNGLPVVKVILPPDAKVISASPLQNGHMLTLNAGSATNLRQTPLAATPAVPLIPQNKVVVTTTTTTGALNAKPTPIVVPYSKVNVEPAALTSPAVAISASIGPSTSTNTTMSVLESQIFDYEGFDPFSNGQYARVGDLTEELADEDLLAILEDVGRPEMEALLSENISMSEYESALPVSEETRTTGSQPNGSTFSGVTSSSPASRDPLEGMGDEPAVTVGSAGTFKQPFVPKVSYAAPVTSSRTAVPLSPPTVSAGMTAVRVEVTGDSMPS